MGKRFERQLCSDPQLIISYVDRYPVYPGEERAFPPERRIGPEGAEKGFLRYVLGIVGISGQRQGQAVYFRVVVAVELLEGFGIILRQSVPRFSGSELIVFPRCTYSGIRCGRALL
jgi:hypothetical protein